MPRQRTSNAKKRPNDKLTAELTSGQLVIGICVSLFFLLVAFLLGVMVNRYQMNAELAKADNTETPAAVPGTPPLEETSPPGAAPERGDEAPTGTQTSPRQPVTVQPAQPTPADKPEPAPRPQPRETVLPPLPAPRNVAPPREAPIRMSRNTGNSVVSEPVEMSPLPGRSRDSEDEAPTLPVPAHPPESPEPPEADPDPVEPPQTEPAEAPAPVNLTGATPSETAPAGPEASPAESAPSTVSSPPPANRGQYGIQVASFQGPGREEGAEEYQRRLQENAQLPSEILVSEDREIYRVVVVGYANREEASAALKDLRQKPSFKDAFLKELP